MSLHVRVLPGIPPRYYCKQPNAMLGQKGLGMWLYSSVATM